MPNYYESDVTKMIRSLLDQKPQITEEQKRGRSMWWDKPIDHDMRKRQKESKVAQQAYVYQTKA